MTNVRKWNKFLTLKNTGSKAMKTLPETILDHSRQLPEGGMLAAKDFLHLGSRAAVDQAFSRLAKVGLLLRVVRGLYVAPVKSRFGTRPPAPEKVVQALAQKAQDVITDSGARAANGLGLTTQVPVRSVYFTRGRGRTFTLGKSTVEIRRVPKWMLSLGATRPGAVIRALAWLGEAHISEAMEKLRKLLSPADWQDLRSVRHLLPSWMGMAISREVV
ncbi:DUF6088 family protein [Pseudomonas aeruginosa]